LGNAIHAEIVNHPVTSPTSIKDVLKQQAALEQFVLAYTVTSGKVVKMQVNTPNGVLVLDVNLKKWEEKT
jgi:hypothetical protein